MTREEFTEIIKASVEDVWYNRRSLDPVKEQTELLVEKLYPLMNKSLPPADATAEAKEIMMKHCSDNGLLSMRLGKSILAAMHEFAAQRQPQPTAKTQCPSICPSTAEGAEEITDEFLDDNFHRRCEGCEEKPAMVSKLLELAALTADKRVENEVEARVQRGIILRYENQIKELKESADKKLRETCQACGDTTLKELHCKCCGNNFPI